MSINATVVANMFQLADFFPVHNCFFNNEQKSHHTGGKEEHSKFSMENNAYSTP